MTIAFMSQSAPLAIRAHLATLRRRNVRATFSSWHRTYCFICMPQIEAIYHTSIVVGGVEIYYGGGIQEAVPGRTPYGRPIQVLDLGCAALPAPV